MQLRPLAPLAVIGAGLLMMSLATHSASADDDGAPGAVDVASADGALVVTWSAPSGTSGLKEYDLIVADPDSGEQVLERSVAADATKATLGLADFGGRSELTISVTAEYDQGAHYPGPSVRVSLPAGPAKPESAPAVRAEGRLLRVSLPEAPDGVTGRIVTLLRDGDEWATVSVAAEKAIVTRKAAAGHSYAASYQDVNAVAASAFSEQSAAVKVSGGTGPSAVRRIRLAAVAEGLKVRWSSAEAQSAQLAQYRVIVTKNGERVGSAYTAGDVRSVVLPGEVGDGAYGVTVVAKDAAGGTSSSTAVVAATR